MNYVTSRQGETQDHGEDNNNCNNQGTRTCFTMVKNGGKVMIIPKDLQRFVRLLFIKRIIVFLLIFAIMCVAIAFINKMSEPVNISYMVSSYTLAFFVSLLMAGISNILLDKTFYGKVVKISVKTTVDSTSPAKPTRETLYYKNTVYLTVETDSGKTIKRKVREVNAGLQSGCSLYKVGDMVFHLRGTKHIIVMPNESNDYVRCSVCGETNNKSEMLCRSCMHTLVK